MRTTTNNPNPRGDLIGEFGAESSDFSDDDRVLTGAIVVENVGTVKTTVGWNAGPARAFTTNPRRCLPESLRWSVSLGRGESPEFDSQ